MNPIPRSYVERLSDRDIALLARYSAESGTPHAVRDRWICVPHEFEQALGSRALFHDVFAAADPESLLQMSPFLVFAVLLTRAGLDVMATPYVNEWLGPGRRVPVFHVDELREFSSAPQHRLFLADVLASYTRVASGSVWVQTARGWRRQRFSELDPIRLIEMLEIVPEDERFAIYRRLGDLMLFLTGVFPEHTWRRFDAPTAARRLQRALSWRRLDLTDTGSSEGPMSAMDVLELVGSRSYRQAGRATWDVAGPGGHMLDDLAERFGQARRLLNFVTDRYLFPHRDAWFSVD